MDDVMKILSDFDGVMTDQSEEADRALAIFREALARHTSISAAQVDALLERASAGVKASPSDYGWTSEGRLSAYSDEDLFIRNISLACWLDVEAAAGHAELGPLRETLRRAGEFETFEALCGWAYHAMTQETSRGELKPMDPVVGEVLRGLLDAGHEVVVVSNSGTDRVKALLEQVDLEPERHTDNPESRLRVRGNARKFILGPDPLPFDEDGRGFDTSRPFYDTILREEQPAVVIGDVFSLDLALPLALARSEDPAVPGDLYLLLRRRSYTPDWAVKLMEAGAERAESVRFRLLDRFDALPGIIGA